jgi:hypothetical protein
MEYSPIWLGTTLKNYSHLLITMMITVITVDMEIMDMQIMDMEIRDMQIMDMQIRTIVTILIE